MTHPGNDNISKADIDHAILRAVLELQEAVKVLAEAMESSSEALDKLIDAIETMARGLGYEFLEEQEPTA